MKIFEAQIDINAPIEIVWQHLTDFSSYPDWNPFILWAEGDLREGSVVRFKVAKQPMPFTAPITSLIPNREFIWEAKTPIPGLQPKYIRRLEPLDDNRTRFINREEFAGWMVPLASPILSMQLGALYPATCQALKARVEALG